MSERQRPYTTDADPGDETPVDLDALRRRAARCVTHHACDCQVYSLALADAAVDALTAELDAARDEAAASHEVAMAQIDMRLRTDDQLAAVTRDRDALTVRLAVVEATLARLAARRGDER